MISAITSLWILTSLETFGLVGGSYYTNIDVLMQENKTCNHNKYKVRLSLQQTLSLNLERIKSQADRFASTNYCVQVNSRASSEVQKSPSNRVYRYKMSWTWNTTKSIDDLTSFTFSESEKKNERLWFYITHIIGHTCLQWRSRSQAQLPLTDLQRLHCFPIIIVELRHVYLLATRKTQERRWHTEIIWQPLQLVQLHLTTTAVVKLSCLI